MHIRSTFFALLAAGAMSSSALAQPNVQLGIVENPPGQLEVQLRPDANFGGLVSSTVVTVRWETTPGVSITTAGILPADLSWLSSVGGILYQGTTTDGIHSYATFATFGFAALDPSDAWVANTDIPFFRLPYTNTSGECVQFEVLDDTYQLNNNFQWYISLNGLDRTNGYIGGKGSATASPAATCQNVTAQLDVNGTATVDPASVSLGYLGCTGVVLSLDQSVFTCADLGTNTVTLTGDANGNISTCTATVTVTVIDTDGDGQDDCVDGCPSDPLKTAPGLCGCGNPDIDTNNNNICDADEIPPHTKLGVVEDPAGFLEFRLLPDDYFDGIVSSTVVTVRWETTAGVSVTSGAALPVDLSWLSSVGPILNFGTSTDGIYTYASFGTVGFSMLGAADAWQANTEVPFFRVPYVNTSGACVTFEVLDDTYQATNNLQWFISLSGEDKTDGYITGKESVVGSPAATCQNVTAQLDVNGTATVDPASVSSGYLGCTGVVLSLDQSVFTCADLGTNTVTLTGDANGNISTCTATVTVTVIDTDGDGQDDCVDGCPSDPLKTAPGLCGCGNPDIDTNNNNICDADEIPPHTKLGVVEDPAGFLEFRLLPDDYFDGIVSSTVVTVRWETTAGVSVTSGAALPVDLSWLSSVGPILNFGTSTDGIYTYASFGTVGFSMLGAADAWQANTEVPFFRVPYVNTSGACVTFEVLDDTYQATNNLQWFISLSGEDKTDGYITGKESVVVHPPATCQNVSVALDGAGMATVTPAMVNTGAYTDCSATLALDQTTFDCSHVGANPVTLTVSFPGGAQSTCSATVTVISTLVASAVEGTILCNGGTTTVTVSATGGTAPYTGDGVMVVSAGPYSFTVTDANGCTSTVSGTITEPAALVASAVEGTILCNGGTTTVTVSATGGTAPYTGDGAMTVSAGPYSFTVTDANGCTSAVSGTITEPAALVASAVEGTILCNGGTTTVTVSATGGTAPYTGDGVMTVSAGPYSFTVTDANGCTSTVSGTITEPAALVASAVEGTILCNGGTTTVTVSATGGTAPYTGDGVMVVSAGPYSFTVTDANGCTSTVSGTITEPAALVASAVEGTILCNGGTTTVTVSATGGTTPYTGDGVMTVSAGPYSFTVTDANGCTSAVSGTITEPAALVASAVEGTILCNGGTTTVTVSATGGTAPYTGDGVMTVSAGPYSFTVTDANGCTSTVSGTITEPAALVASAVEGTILCNGGTTTVTVSATGGTTPYTGDGVMTVSAGPYSFTVTDANGCTSTVSGTITEPSMIVVTAIHGTIDCAGGTTPVTVSASGGTSPYTGEGVFNETAGVYMYTVTDANGCTASATATVIEMIIDSDGDGVCDALDVCPGGPEPGMPCDDNDSGTINDVVLPNCTCAGTPVTVTIAPKVFLDGPYNAGSGSMNDALRAAGYVPLSEPYTSIGYGFVSGGSETISASVLAVTGPDAIVDWVVLELRSAVSPSVIVYSRSALVQSDGDVVDLDGISSVTCAMPPDNYHLAIIHRTHLGAMTATPVAMSNLPVTIDFTLAATPTFGVDARKNVGAVMTLWAGNVLQDDRLKYTGSLNDRDPMLTAIGGTVPTNTLAGYHLEDVNMDGLVKYTGGLNDRDVLLLSIGGTVPTAIRIEQLP